MSETVETVDRVISVIAIVSGVAAICYVWQPRRFKRARLGSEISFELGVFVLLILSVSTFAADTDGARRRIKWSFALHYVTAAVGVVALVLTLIFTMRRTIDDPSVKLFSRRASRFAWVFLACSATRIDSEPSQELVGVDLDPSL